MTTPLAAYRDTFKYYGYNEVPNRVVYPMPVIKHSRTFAKQASLPPLPVPPLNQSLHKYLNAVKPLLNEQEFDHTREIVKRFHANGNADKLQRMLYERSSRTDNWLAQWWLDKVYLEPRYGVAINVNPNTLFPKANYKSLDEQLLFATNFINGFVEYKRLIDNQQLPVEKYLDNPLCMDQYPKIVGTCRVPHRNKCELKTYQPYLSNAKNVTVMYKNRIFSLPVLNQNGDALLNRSEIFTNLKNLVQNTKNSDEFGLGILTSENRDVWADAYEILVKDERNRKNFESIHESLFVLCIDDTEGHANDIDRSQQAAQLLHGSKTYSSNRWFDKIIQVIVSSNGVCGMNFEHSVAEALPHANLGDYVLSFIEKSANADVTYLNASQASPYSELSFTVDPQVRATIQTAKENFYKQIDNLDLYLFNFDHFGKNFPKSQRMSPDAFVQIAMQLAYFNIHKTWASTYETGSLRRFKLGRTDIIRSCSEPTVQFLQSTSKSSSTAKERATLLLNAINAHNKYTKEVLNCETFDRHLLGLKLTALENNLPVPELFDDIAYKRLTHYHLSTSQVSSKHATVCSYAPSVDDGYGVCYNILENKLMFGLSSFNSCKTTSARVLADNLNESLLECQKLLLGNTVAKL